jgi:hypothetical protein
MEIPRLTTYQKRLISNIITGIFMGLLLGILIYILVLQIESDSTQLREFNFRKNEWFSANVTISNGFRVNHAVVNDELFYKISFNRLTDDSIKLEPVFSVLYGGSEVINDIKPTINLIDIKNAGDTYRFFLDKIGENQIVLKIKVINMTVNDGRELGTLATTMNLDVHSLSDKINTVGNSKQSSAIIISAVIGLLTVLALFTNIIISKRHLDEITKQGFDHNRPWIGIDDTAQLQLEIGDESVRIYLKNHGNLLAKDVTTWVHSSETEIKSEEEIMKGSKDNPIDIAPRETFLQSIKYPDNKKKDNFSRIFIGIHITYNISDSKKHGKSTIIINLDMKGKDDQYTIRTLD